MKSLENSVWENNEETFDVVVIGAGHAGCEAAMAVTALGCSCLLLTVSTQSIALMPCNPNIGGTSKGHLVREIDALGGVMGKIIDQSFLQSKMLNRSKGPAVHSLRAQADKALYSQNMRSLLQQQEHLMIRQMEACKLLMKDNQVIGIESISGSKINAKAIILCTGTYLNAKCIYGDVANFTGPDGLQAANHLTASLDLLGIAHRRFKTGTPARIDKRSIDFSVMEEQKGDEVVTPFSFTTNPDDVQIDQISCFLTYTNEITHEIIRSNLDRSPLFSGVIEGTGPRYCPSIEDKVVRFPDKTRHQVFIEPEGLSTNEMYIAGMSSSLPWDVQVQMYRSVKGLENAHLIKNAYAIEYDCIDATQLKSTLEFKQYDGLYSAGQINGSSGYEEAAAQGLIAGINAARKIHGQKAFTLSRAEAYIGVLIDDLITKVNHEPYRMMTSRAEYRLLLRQDNADVRLTPKGYEIGLIDEERFHSFQDKQAAVENELKRIKSVFVGTDEKVQSLLRSFGSTELISGISLEELIRRPELNYHALAPIDEGRMTLPEDVCEQVEIRIKYQGYIERQMRQVAHFEKHEQKQIPMAIDYDDVPSLRIEARQKLTAMRPETIGQASRISGVTPADINVLLVYLKMING